MSLHVTPQERRPRTKILRDHKAKLPKHVAYAKREHVEQAIESHLAEVDALIGVLDLYDGDAADYENDRSDYESTTGGSIDQGSSTAKGYWMDDLEDDQSDSEPSLAHTNDIDQERATRHLGALTIGATWITGDQDLEQEHDGREPCCEDEGAQCDDEGVDSDSEPEMGDTDAVHRAELHPEVKSFAFIR